jgi:hypothetical protein
MRPGFISISGKTTIDVDVLSGNMTLGGAKDYQSSRVGWVLSHALGG